jgi:hypothetical protein
MSSVLETIPRIIYPTDIKTQVIHVAGEWHYVCGVSASEKNGTFMFHKIRRKSYVMYPEGVLGPCAIGNHYVRACGEFVRKYSGVDAKEWPGSIRSLFHALDSDLYKELAYY